jgi:hypothetical protein
MRWTFGLLVAAAAIAVAVACGSGGGSGEVLPQTDGGTDGSVDAGYDAGQDAGTDAGYGGVDAGTDAGYGGVDAGTDGGTDGSVAWAPGDIMTVQNGNGWTFASDGLPSGSVMGASADENGNIWVAGRANGIYVQRGGVGQFQQFTIADGLHPYGYLPDGSPADPNPSLSVTPAISITGGPGSSAYVGYQGKDRCEDEWDAYGPTNHAMANPSIYKSGDADRVVLNGSGINVAHYDISSGPNMVPNELAGREKLCTIFRIVWQRGSKRRVDDPNDHGFVWFGGNHGYAMGYADYAGNPTCNGQRNCSGNLEHSHPAINDSHGWFLTGDYYGIAVDTVPHLDSSGNTFYDVWFGGKYRTTRFRFGETLGDFYTALNRTELYASSPATASNIATDPPAQAAFWNRMDIWPDPRGERRLIPGPQYWLSQEPDKNNPADFVLDLVSGIAVTKDGSAWIGSFQNGLRIIDHDGHFLADANVNNNALKTNAVGAIVKDPTDESIWVGYQDGGFGLTRIKQDGTVMHYGNAAIGSMVSSPVNDIQVQPATATSKRRIIVAFRNGAVGFYDGD